MVALEPRTPAHSFRRASPTARTSSRSPAPTAAAPSRRSASTTHRRGSRSRSIRHPTLPDGTTPRSRQRSTAPTRWRVWRHVHHRPRPATRRATRSNSVGRRPTRPGSTDDRRRAPCASISQRRKTPVVSVVPDTITVGQTAVLTATSSDALSGLNGGEWWLGDDPGAGNATPLEPSTASLTAVMPERSGRGHPSTLGAGPRRGRELERPIVDQPGGQRREQHAADRRCADRGDRRGHRARRSFCRAVTPTRPTCSSSR